MYIGQTTLTFIIYSTKVKTPENGNICRRTFIEAPTHLFSKYLLITCGPGPVLDARETVNNTNKGPCSRGRRQSINK